MKNGHSPMLERALGREHGGSGRHSVVRVQSNADCGSFWKRDIAELAVMVFMEVCIASAVRAENPPIFVNPTWQAHCNRTADLLSRWCSHALSFCRTYSQVCELAIILVVRYLPLAVYGRPVQLHKLRSLAHRQRPPQEPPGR